MSRRQPNANRQRVTKDEFLKSLDPLQCSLCLEPYDAQHVPVEIACGHVFGDYCIANVAESETQNNNRCPLCRCKLFEQEDFDSDGELIQGRYDEEGGYEEQRIDAEIERIGEQNRLNAAAWEQRQADMALTEQHGSNARESVDQGRTSNSSRQQRDRSTVRSPRSGQGHGDDWLENQTQYVAHTHGSSHRTHRHGRPTDANDRGHGDDWLENQTQYVAHTHGSSHRTHRHGRPTDADDRGHGDDWLRNQTQYVAQTHGSSHRTHRHGRPTDADDEGPPRHASRNENESTTSGVEEESEDSDMESEEESEESDGDDLIIAIEMDYSSSESDTHPESEYEPTDDDYDSDHENDDQWRAKLRPEDGGRRTCVGRA